MATRLKEKYQKEIVPKLTKEFGIQNTMAVPKLNCIVLNMGMGEATANVKILVDHRDNALKIPNAALRYRPAASAAKTANINRKARGASASQIIWTLSADGKPQPVEVQLGISDGTWTEVRSGNLQEGESVILGASSQSATSTSATASPFGGGASRRGPGF